MGVMFWWAQGGISVPLGCFEVVGVRYRGTWSGGGGRTVEQVGQVGLDRVGRVGLGGVRGGGGAV